MQLGPVITKAISKAFLMGEWECYMERGMILRHNLRMVAFGRTMIRGWIQY